MTISRFRGIEALKFEPGARCVILGPQNAGKSTVLEALDLLLHHGLGRPRQPPTEIDYFGRRPEEGFEVEAVLGELNGTFLAEVREYLEGWRSETHEVADLDPATQALRDALRAGAEKVNTDSAVGDVLADLADDLRNLGLLEAEELPSFEAGALSQRQLLQSLRLAMPAGEGTIPLFRQGRGAQRLILISVLLRLAELATGDEPVVGGFEEPEEALEPLRQAQLAGMLIKLADRGGQVFVVTHSPEIVRRFEIDDLLLMSERAAGRGAVALRCELGPPVRQTYERRLDGAVVRGLFARIPVLVEGPGDRAVFDVFWRSLAETGRVRPAEELGLDAVNCEGASGIPMHAAVLKQAGKKVVAWAERDTLDICEILGRLRREGN